MPTGFPVDQPPPWRRIVVPGEPHIAAERTGSGASPIVAIHGLGVQRRCFNTLARNLEHKGGVLTLDLRGRGETPATPGSAGLRVHAEDVIRAMDAAGVEKTVLLGHSMGAYVALEVARRHPERVAGIVLVDGGWPLPRPLDWMTPGPWTDALASMGLMSTASRRMTRAATSAADHAAWWARVAGEPAAAPSADTLDMARHDLRQTADGRLVPRVNTVAVAAEIWLMPLQAPTEGDLAAISCPVVLVRAGHGATARSRPLVGQRQRRALTRALALEDVELPDATHYSIILWRNGVRLAEISDGLARRVLGPAIPPRALD